MLEFIKNLFKKKLTASDLNNFRRSHQIRFDDLCKQANMTPYESPIVKITNSAKTYLTTAAKNSGKSYVWFGVDGGGCNGFQYKWDFIEEPDSKDQTFVLGHTQSGSEPARDIIFVIDMASEMFVMGSEIDWVNELGGQYLKVNNPMAQSQCGCGTSFSA